MQMSKRRKCKIVISACVAAVCCTVLMGLHFARYDSTVQYQLYAKQEFGKLYDDSTAYYDVSCSDGPMVDTMLAKDIWVEILQDCESQDNSDNSSCLKTGSRWSHIYLANGIILLFLVLNMACVGFGVWFKQLVWVRIVGSISGVCLCCGHLVCVIVSAVYRLNSWGTLCSLSLAPSYASMSKDNPDKPYYVNDSWTYKEDGALILALFII